MYPFACKPTGCIGAVKTIECTDPWDTFLSESFLTAEQDSSNFFLNVFFTESLLGIVVMTQ